MKNEINVLQLIIRVFVLDIWELAFIKKWTNVWNLTPESSNFQVVNNKKESKLVSGFRACLGLAA